MSHSLVPIVKKRLLFRKFEFKKKAAGGCESKACEEMEKKEFNRRLKEPQTHQTICWEPSGVTAKVYGSMYRSVDMDGTKQYEEGTWFG